MELKAIAMIELNSIAKGVHAGDEMLKSSDVELVMAQPICAGKYMVLVSGDVDSVERAWEVGKETAEEFLVDDFVIPNVHASIFPALTATTRIHDIDSLAVILDRHEDRIPFPPECNHNPTLVGLFQSVSCRRGFNTMIDGVAQNMGQGIYQRLQDGPVKPDRIALNRQFYGFVELFRQFCHVFLEHRAKG